jgi:hypothetical protein
MEVEEPTERNYVVNLLRGVSRGRRNGLRVKKEAR